MGEALASGDEIFTLRILERIRFSSSHIDSFTDIRPDAHTESPGRTEHDHVNSRFVKLLCYYLTTRTGAIVGIVDDDLSTRVEEVPNKFLAALEDVLTQLDSFLALVSLCTLSFSFFMRLRQSGDVPSVK